MSIKKLIILFLILFFLPAVLGKVSLAPFSDFFQHISWQSFTHAFSKVLADDISYYKGFITPWLNKLIDLIKPKNAFQAP